jgi:hypothetical protein
MVKSGSPLVKPNSPLVKTGSPLSKVNSPLVKKGSPVVKNNHMDRSLFDQMNSGGQISAENFPIMAYDQKKVKMVMHAGCEDDSQARVCSN